MLLDPVVCLNVIVIYGREVNNKCNSNSHNKY